MRKTQLPFEREHVDGVGDIDYFPCYIAGEPWRYAVVTTEQMKKLADDPSSDTAGLCKTDDSAVYFLAGQLSHTVAIHELAHAQFSETLTHSADLTPDQVEEVMCDIMAFNWFRVVLLARVIIHNLLCYEDYLKGNKDQDWEPAQPDVLLGRVPEHLIDLLATYIHSCGLSPLTKAIGKKKRKRALLK